MKLKHLIRALAAMFAVTLVGSVAAANTPPVILEARATPNPMLWNPAAVYTIAAQDADGDAPAYRWSRESSACSFAHHRAAAGSRTTEPLPGRAAAMTVADRDPFELMKLL